MDLSVFFMENAQAMAQEEITVSERFRDGAGEPARFLLRAVTEAENTDIRRACRKKVKGKNGVFSTETDADLYLSKLAAACVVRPDLKDAALQRSWGVLGDDALLRRMLSAGEFAYLLSKVQEICGFDLTLDEMKDELKN